MRNFFLVLCSIFICSIPTFLSCTEKQTDLKIGVISDIHYLSDSLMDDGDAINKYVENGGKSVKDVPDVLNLVLNDYLDSDIRVLLIPGDLTKDGEKQSHLDLVEKLEPLINKGIQIFVIPGNHDINIPNPLGYNGTQTYRVENINPSEFVSIYNKFGFDKALARDSASLSYVAELDKNTWLIAIDACKYEEYKDRSISSGRIKPSTEQWILSILDKAKEQNKQVVGMMHQGLVEHIVMQGTFFKDYLVDDWQRLAPLFADNGMKVIFTGHFHANDITQYISPKGNEIFDIETGSLSAYPFPYRFISLSNNEIKIETKNILATKNNPTLAETSKQQLKRQAKKRAYSMLQNFGISFPDSIKSNIEEIAGEVFIKHIQGDEVVDDRLKVSIINLSTFFDDPKLNRLEDINLDLYPADNNVLIRFNQKRDN